MKKSFIISGPDVCDYQTTSKAFVRFCGCDSRRVGEIMGTKYLLTA